MPSVAGKRVVIFGDSLSESDGPGYALGEALARAGASVKIDSLRSRSASNFFWREVPTDHWASIAAFHPDIAIVELGTNDIGLNLVADGARMAEIKGALAKAGASQIYAFGPPTFPDPAKNTGAVDVVAMMRDVFGSRFIDLRPLTTDMLSVDRGRAGDGVHFAATGSKQLGGRMAQSFMAADSGSGASLLIAVGIGVLAWLALR